jgi:hypothetical protein
MGNAGVSPLVIDQGARREAGRKAVHRGDDDRVVTAVVFGLERAIEPRGRRGQVVDARDGLNMTSGGSRDSELNDWQVSPSGPPAPSEATTVMPEQKLPSCRHYK